MNYPYYGWGSPPPPMYPPHTPQLTEDHFKKGMEFATKFALREEREKERKKFRDRRDRDEETKKKRESRNYTLLFVEWYILGILSYPFVGPIYNAMKVAAETAYK